MTIRRNIVDQLNKYAKQQNFEDVNEAFVTETRDQFGNIIRREITERSQRKEDIEASIRNRNFGATRVNIDSSLSVINNFFSVGIEPQTTRRLIPTPEMFTGVPLRKNSPDALKSRTKQNKPIGTVQNNNEQGGKS